MEINAEIWVSLLKLTLQAFQEQLIIEAGWRTPRPQHQPQETILQAGNVTTTPQVLLSNVAGTTSQTPCLETQVQLPLDTNAILPLQGSKNEAGFSLR